MKRAPYSADPLASRGRRFAEPASGNRSDFQRDRDRIVHSTAFRRLEYKTQVFLNHEGDHFRTRLTHSIEVAQIARTIGRTLALDEDLIEAIALAHDLGHTPFGHAGQDALNDCMQPFGGFEHNLQSLRVVESLEQRYFEFDGLNLCFETREGILKHCSLKDARKLGELGERFLRGEQPSMEAQVANLADEIAYNNHDVDDGLRSGLVTLAQLESVELFADHARVVRATWPSIQGRRLVHETVRRMINELVLDLLAETQRRLTVVAPDSIEAVRGAGPLVAFSAGMTTRSGKLKQFLRDRLYRHERVRSVMDDAKSIVRALFEAFVSQPEKLPEEHRARVESIGERAVADYIAGMTDRFAIREHERLFGPREGALGRSV